LRLDRDEGRTFDEFKVAVAILQRDLVLRHCPRFLRLGWSRVNFATDMSIQWHLGRDQLDTLDPFRQTTTRDYRAKSENRREKS
jgi:hypothetical protein